MRIARAVLIDKYFYDNHLGGRGGDGRGMWHVWGRGEAHTGFWRGDLRVRDHLEDMGVDWRVILKLSLEK